jgi:hypothetical protein
MSATTKQIFLRTDVEMHTLAEVATMLRLSEQVKDPERWLKRRLNSRELRGVRVGREWRMTDDHVRFLVKKYSTDDQVPEPEPPAEPVAPVPEVGSIVDGLSPRSRRRLQSGGAAVEAQP